MTSFRLSKARQAEEIAAAAALLREYADWLGIDLSFQDFDAELRELPGQYAPPTGELLLAHSVDGDVLGCVALRPLEELDRNTALDFKDIVRRHSEVIAADRKSVV